MYLEKLEIKNFRGIEKLELDFSEGLNVLIGENNTGKTSIVEAIVLALSIGQQKKEVYMSVDDFFIDKNGNKKDEIEFSLTFSGLTEEEKGIYYEMLTFDPSLSSFKVKFKIRYKLKRDGGTEKVKFLGIFGSGQEGSYIPFDLMDLFNFVYLNALRDSEKDLRPQRGSRIAQLLLRLESSKEKQDAHAKRLTDRIKDDEEWMHLIEKGKSKINKHLKEVSLKGELNKVNLEFIPLEFSRLVENLQLILPYSSKEKNKTNEEIENNSINFTIEQIGLGYNNLIYISTVLGDLIERKKIEPSSYAALLIEEPEAHLHPQLQNVLFKYLENIEKEGIQVFVTSHSPTITAKTNLDSVIVLYKEKDNKISSLSLKNCSLSRKDRLFLQRFLDVTKAQLFFAKGILLVEGISEALLLPLFAKIMGEDYDLTKNGIEVVNINGVAFEPFAKLFNSDNPENRLNFRCAIITDDDRDTEGNLSDRAKKAKGLEGGNLKVFLLNHTFEYELFIADKANGELMKSIFRSFHKKSNIKGQTIEGEAMDLVNKLRQYKEKALFAQELSYRLKDEAIRINFKVPAKIQEAIKWVVKGNER